ncbi:MAG: DUF4007 family protein [Firmicutes bacterium]|nr:DUF4007 family protein [Bacillota bacterium]
MNIQYRFSGHESFPFRYAWLPKAFRQLEANPQLFADESCAMVDLGVGKNMVRAIRFWVQVTGVAQPTDKGFEPTTFGRRILSDYDMYLEDTRTLWLLHWNVATRVEDPLFAWDYLLNRWQRPELCRSEVLRAFGDEAIRLERTLSDVTLAQHFDVFLHTYVPAADSAEVHEDSLDCPLSELRLIQAVGERQVGMGGRRETVYSFRREPKPEITHALFAFCIDDFWRKRRGNEQTLTFRDIAVAEGSLGQVFKLPEQDLRDRLELYRSPGGVFRFEESLARQILTRGSEQEVDLLSAVYEDEGAQ